MTDNSLRPSDGSRYASFLKIELRILLVSGLLTLLGMTVLFIAPVFVNGDLDSMSIVSRVILPMRAWLFMFVLGTIVNLLVHLVRRYS